MPSSNNVQVEGYFQYEEIIAPDNVRAGDGTEYRWLTDAFRESIQQNDETVQYIDVFDEHAKKTPGAKIGKPSNATPDGYGIYVPIN